MHQASDLLKKPSDFWEGRERFYCTLMFVASLGIMLVLWILLSVFVCSAKTAFTLLVLAWLASSTFSLAVTYLLSDVNGTFMYFFIHSYIGGYISLLAAVHTIRERCK